MMPTGLVILLLPMVLVGLFVVLLGVLLVRTGRRGAVVDEHPLCGKCGFDLIGQPASSDRCPECGSNLDDLHAIVIGHRRPRPLMTALGLLILLIGLTLAGTSAVSVGRQVDWASLKPTWWLLREAGSANRSTRSTAMAYLIARDNDEKLDPAHHQALIMRALAHQADLSVPWDPAWGTFLATCAERGELTSEQLEGFLTTMLRPVVITVRKDIRIGDPLRIVVSAGGSRMPGQTRLSGFHRSRDETFLVDGQPVSSLPYSPGESGGGSTLNFTNSIYTTLDGDRLTPFGVGEHELTFQTAIEVRDGFGEGAPALLRVPVNAKAKFTIHPKDAQLVKLISDPALAAAFEQAITGKIRLGPHNASVEINPRDAARAAAVVPVNFAFHVIVKQGKQQWLAGTMSARAGRVGSHTFGAHLEGIEPGKADIVLRSSADAAKWSIDLFEIWDGEIVLKDVEIEQN